MKPETIRRTVVKYFLDRALLPEDAAAWGRHFATLHDELSPEGKTNLEEMLRGAVKWMKNHAAR